MTEIVDNGIKYDIVDGKVVEASVTEQPSDTLSIKANDRIAYKTKLGTVVGIVASIYGESAVVKFDDGSLDELHVDDLKLSSIEKTAAVESTGGLAEDYKVYSAMPSDTEEEIRIKEATARELNLRAKAAVTNRRLALADQIAYDSIVTATAVDILDLQEAAAFAHASESSYMQTLPQFRMPEEVSSAFGMTRGGDASWLLEAAEESPIVDADDAVLATRADNAIAQFSRKQLEDDDLIDLALTYATDSLVASDEKKEKFGFFFREARAQRLADETEFQKKASVDETDLNGNVFSLEDTPIEALYGD